MVPMQKELEVARKLALAAGAILMDYFEKSVSIDWKAPGDPVTAADLYTMPAKGGVLTPLLRTKAYEAAAVVSPDGKWIVYVSDESGRMNIYLRPSDGTERKWTVSSQGGTHPIWSVDGHRVFYRFGD